MQSIEVVGNTVAVAGELTQIDDLFKLMRREKLQGRLHQLQMWMTALVCYDMRVSAERLLCIMTNRRAVAG